MVSDINVVCRGCDRCVRMDSVVFDDVRNAFVCEACFSATHSAPKSSSRSPVVDEAVKSVDSLKDSLVKYTCVKCRYHFARRRDKSVGVCPYCGFEKLEVLDSSASKILSDD